MHSIQNLRARSSKNLERLRRAISFNVGDWKKTRLVKALGKRLAKATLLDDSRHQEHADRLFRRFRREWGYLSQEEATKHLRFLTILDTVVEVDANKMYEACRALEHRIDFLLRNDSNRIGCIGCVEMEIVNLGHSEKRMEEVSANPHTGQSSEAQSLRRNEQRKLAVLRAMREQVAPNTLFHQNDPTKSWVLIHFHGLLYLNGATDTDIVTLCQRIGKNLRREWSIPYAVELKRTFDEQTTRRKLLAVADYITKGGNERLRYETRFGRGTSSLDVMERAMVKQGCRGIDRDTGEECAIEDTIGLTLGEVEALGKTIHRLMKRTYRRDGYVLLLGRCDRRSVKSRWMYSYTTWGKKGVQSNEPGDSCQFEKNQGALGRVKNRIP